MEKLERLDLPTTRNEPLEKANRKSAWIAIGFRETLLLLCLFLGWRYQLLGQLVDLLRSDGEIRVSGGIAWAPCADLTEFECAYLSVPMDYTNPLPNETVSLSLRRLPATAPMTDRMGTLFINPGGPGGSGTNAVARYGQDLHTILKGRYDILSWDPRGVNQTTPSLDCFATEFDEFIQHFKEWQLGLPFEMKEATGSDDIWFEKIDAYYRSTVASCAKNGNQKMLKSVSTAFVVRDIVSILDALGEKDRGLQYWGFSYGTILGATFSALFPELVHRVVLDGVSSARFYSQDIFEWGRSGMDETYKVWDGFLAACAEAGPGRCALAKDGFTTDDVRMRVEKIINDLVAKPLPVPFSVQSGIITASDVLYAIFRGLYAPKGWPDIATAIAEAESGNGTALLRELPLTDRKGMLDNVFNRYTTRLGSEVTTEAIMCGDTDPSVSHAVAYASTEAFNEYSKELAKLSITGEIWAEWVGRCRIWNITATESYRGPWTVKDGLKKTKFPVLFLGNTADPVTPLSAAKDMSKGFGSESASLLIQDGFGHCSLAHPSLCTARTIASYFIDGKVPEYGTVCPSDDGFLFPESAKANERLQGLSEEDQKLMRALDTLSTEWVGRKWV
ncbi:alpha/beta-hydrolase [Calocera viscosa TUFC12733]|uniref:Alpha/beta-hydrolase n=1 Tax=Calocera viscosa (strain TUFC12733) TaxID=1330018 RepID=A0A167LUB4_CALVF|nr:alpha/beta-hydrolase [Calocera viscosa TUFC12733]